MQLTDLALANLALGRLGEGKPLTALGVATLPASYWASVFLPIVKAALLASHPWSFAKRSADLVAATVDDVPTGWTYAYTLPTDLVTPLSLWNGDRRPPPENEYPFELVFATNGATKLQVLATDVLDPTLLYITDTLTESAVVPGPYVEALAWALAAELAMPLGKDMQRALALRQMAERARQQAVAFDMNTRRRDPEPDPQSLTSRL